MDIIPAIDLINQSCVRLVEGDFNQRTDYSSDPLQVAKTYEKIGLKRLHIVDLAGAKAKSPQHLELLRAICSETTLEIDFGGGIRNEQQVERVLDFGAKMVSLGSIAVEQPNLVKSWIERFGADRFFLGADVKNGFIATQAWTKQTDMDLFSFIDSWMCAGVKNFFCTDISRDGKLTGPATDLYLSILMKFPGIHLVASGGVSQLGDLSSLHQIGMGGVIIGKAIYEGNISLDQLKNWKPDAR